MLAYQRVPAALRVLLVVAMLVIASVLADASAGFGAGPIVCPFRLITGLPCPFCGSTRAVGALLQLDIERSLALNPLGAVSLVILVFAAVLPQRARSAFHALRVGWQSASRTRRWQIAVAAYALLWLWGAQRIVETWQESGFSESLLARI